MPLKAPGYVHLDVSNYLEVCRCLLWRRECHLLHLLLLRFQRMRHSPKVSVCQCWLRIGSRRHWRGRGPVVVCASCSLAAISPGKDLNFSSSFCSKVFGAPSGTVSRYCCSFAILVLRFSALKVTALFSVWFSRSSLRRLLTCCLKRTWIGVLICGFVQGLMGFGFLQ